VNHPVAAHNDGKVMRDIFTELFENQPLDPTEAARRAVRPVLRKRFYQRAHVGESEGPAGLPVLIDGKSVRTPARRLLAAPTRTLAEQVAAEWNAQDDVIDPARMPLTRLANAVIDAVADKPAPVAEEIAKFLGSDLVFYRADRPEGLIARQAEFWDPVMAWARDALGARFVQVEGVIYAAQPPEAIAAARAAIPGHETDLQANPQPDALEVWRLGATSSICALTGSALLALAVAHGAIGPEQAWTAAHVDEDWQMAQWGRDDIALDRRAFRHAEFEAAATVLRLV
jgi:chaperone required for assembly of F1-ATPase